MPTHPYQRNLTLFVAFRVLFNARFYYPVLGVLMLDLGITLEQYALLNAIWAATIIVLEIPSGALADIIGRRRMVIAASVLMCVEIALFAFAPSGPWLVWALALNRLLSGAAEASASGADEALAYDSLAPGSRDQEWPKTLARLVRWSSGAFFVAMILGAAAFDANLVNRATAWLGIATSWTPAETVRWPVYLTLASALLATACALLMREPPREHPPATTTPVRAALANCLTAARFVFTSRKILLLLLAGVLFDSIIRLFLTFASNYYRLIELPPFTNGLLGSAFAILGFLAASLARSFAGRLKPPTIATILGVILLTGLLGLCAATPIWGAWVLIPFGLVMPMVQFFLSNYLNAWTSSALRATVLSFRGVAINLGYGLAGIAFATVTSRIRDFSPALTENQLFGQTLVMLPAAFLAGAAALFLFARLTRPRSPRSA